MGLGFAEVSMKEVFEERKRDQQAIEEWAKGRKLKKCPDCGGAYTYDPSTEQDPGACQGCRNAEGELIYR